MEEVWSTRDSDESEIALRKHMDGSYDFALDDFNAPTMAHIVLARKDLKDLFDVIGHEIGYWPVVNGLLDKIDEQKKELEKQLPKRGKEG